MWLPDKSEALEFLRTYIKAENLIRHMIATDAIMRALARKLGQDENLWGITGLLHDMDLEIVDNNMKRHTRETARILEQKGFPPEGIEAIQSHNEEAGVVRISKPFHYALTAAETITGMVVACTLVYPSKKVADVQPKSIRKRMKETRFAANVNRESIMAVEKLGIPLDDFIGLSLEAMKGVAAEIGL
jgi:putative nucleotidyltransferase with HDIG domain